jgi:hypothetical protein
MKVILALHDPVVLDTYKMLATTFGAEVILPKSMSTQSTLEALANHSPDKVMMDVNLGNPGKDNYEPFLNVEEAMRARNYDTKTSLLGVTAKPYLADDIRQKHQLQVAEKPTDNAVIFKFLRE